MKLTEFYAGKCDVAVIGAGHAGIEAALAAARMGLDTICFAINLDSIGNMPCNPAIGGTGKGHLVRELDALGGEMAKVADKACIQYRMLNRGKGPAVHSLRAQADRRRYQEVMKLTLEDQEKLRVKQAEVVEIRTENGAVSAVKTHTGAVYSCRAAIVACGTYLDGRTIVGDVIRSSGPDGLAAAKGLTPCLEALGLSMRRFKTGTPPRVNAHSVDFSKMELQPGDDEPEGFSFETTTPPENRAVCYLTYTNEKTHRIILDNIDRSPIYSGVIEGIGPRYCPSIETKIVTFADKPQHQLFLEPEGETTQEYYLNGFSSSLPLDIQLRALQQIPAFRDIQIYRPGYAIEYDFFDPTQLHHNLETKQIRNLFFAGQINGTTGYEEAGGQGLVAGINAHINCHGGDPFVLGRDEAYIGVLIDDLVTKGVDEPYRMFTSRAEYRILLRQDDADMRLTEKSYHLGLAKQDRYDLLKEKKASRDAIISFAENYSIKPQYINSGLEALGTTPLAHGCKLIELIPRPQITLENIAELVPAFRTELDKVPVSRKEEIIEAAEILIKYSGYIRREQIIADKINRLENIHIKGKFDYNAIQSLSTEARQKLTRIDPDTIAQASRIPGISPSDINILLVMLGR